MLHGLAWVWCMAMRRHGYGVSVGQAWRGYRMIVWTVNYGGGHGTAPMVAMPSRMDADADECGERLTARYHICAFPNGPGKITPSA